jgi:hypothetical protein
VESSGAAVDSGLVPEGTKTVGPGLLSAGLVSATVVSVTPGTEVVAPAEHLVQIVEVEVTTMVDRVVDVVT